MKKELLSAKITTAIAAVALIVSCLAFSCVNGSLAWFSENKSVAVNGVAVKLQDVNDKVEKIEYFSISSIKLDASTNKNIYEFSATPISEQTDIALGTLSPIVAERQILMKITLKSNIRTVHISAQSQADSYIIKETSEGEVPEFFSNDGNSMSSVIQFRAVANVTASEDFYSINEATLSEASHFASVETDESGVTIGFSDSIENVYTTPVGNTDTAVYILLDYYEPSCEYIHDYVKHLLSIQSEDAPLTDAVMGVNINFISDFQFNIG